MSKILVGLVVAAAAIGAPALSFAQSNGPLTREQVRADLVRVEQAGYDPSRGNDIHYPDDIQAAEAKVAAQNDPQSTSVAVGGVAQSSDTAAGAPVHMSTQPACTGPVSFCNVFFGS
jgi:Domain of unknown function (DUF4148)